MTLFQQIHKERLDSQESRRGETLVALERALKQVFPAGTPIIVFGSILSAGRFTHHSDVDLALLEPLSDAEQTRIVVGLEETLRRRVDLLILAETREALREKILRQGERWTV
jgi:predicted nucleotidyltransferase